ncbi:RibD family protein [Saccharospirillum sp. MSK14-1]|uniref:RibD family protein n=1 Tax=Saccharospirillum sp. MSK14-1 TaxID=1897632 RepID=UPI000D37C1DD|nr:RibD family protein [Saccharospirillum sp. MSK14-1]
MTLNQDIEHWLLAEQKTTQDSAPNRPHVTLSYAQSWDGSITTVPGETMALSSDASMQMTHQLRSLHDGILVGIGTVLADNPRLNVRKWTGNDPQPIVLDSQLRMPPSCKLCQKAERGCWVLTTPEAQTDRDDCELIVVPGDADGHVNLHAAMDVLYERGIRSLMVEGGASVITAFLRSGLADAVILTVAPMFVGGYNAVGPLGDADNLPFPQIGDLHSQQLGNELIVWGRLCYVSDAKPGLES